MENVVSIQQYVPKVNQKAPLSILVVDDDAKVRSIMGRTLERLGYKVTLAASVQDALALADLIKPGLVFADFHLGDNQPNGLDLIAALKEKMPGTFVALMSGRIISITRPADVFLLKPLTLDSIRSAINAYLQQD